MKKRILMAFLSLTVVLAVVGASFAVLRPVETKAVTPPKLVKISKKTANLNIPTNALKKKNGKYYVDTKKLEQVAVNVAKKGKLKFVEYRFGKYTLTYTNPNGKVKGQLNGKGWITVNLKNGEEYRYFNKKTGVMYKGLKVIDGQPRYFNKKTGYLLRNGKVKVNGSYLYFNEYGFLIDADQ